MINGKKVVAITLARGGSKKIPRKNIADINGKPLIAYTFEAVKDSRHIDRYLVSTDDDEIASICKSFNVETIMRPIDLAQDISKSSESLIHAVNNLNEDFYYVIEIMATNPLKSTEDIDGVISMIDERQSHSVASVVQIYDHHPSRVKFLSEDGVMNDFYPEIVESRRQDLTPNAYVRNGSIYAMTRSFLLYSGCRYDKKSLAYIMPEERSLNIDEPTDLLLARSILEKNDV